MSVFGGSIAGEVQQTTAVNSMYDTFNEHLMYFAAQLVFREYTSQLNR